MVIDVRDCEAGVITTDNGGFAAVAPAHSQGVRRGTAGQVQTQIKCLAKPVNLVLKITVDHERLRNRRWPLHYNLDLDSQTGSLTRRADSRNVNRVQAIRQGLSQRTAPIAVGVSVGTAGQRRRVKSQNNMRPGPGYAGNSRIRAYSQPFNSAVNRGVGA